MRLRSEAGTSLIELIVGAAIALIVLGAIVNLQIQTYRSHRADESRFVTQMEAANALDRLVADLRMASRITGLEAGGSSAVTLMVGGRAVAYTFLVDRAEVVREEDGQRLTLGQGVERFHLAWASDGQTVQIEWVGRLADGSPYRLTSSSHPRLPTH